MYWADMSTKAHAVIKNKSAVHVVKAIYRMVGLHIFLLFCVAFPLGVCMGGAEILMAYTLQMVLTYFKLLPNWDQLYWMAEFFSPISLLLIVTLGIAILRVALQLLPSLTYSAFETRVYNAVIKNVLIHQPKLSSLTITDITYISSHLTRKVSSFFQSTTTSIGIVLIMIFVGSSLFIISW